MQFLKMRISSQPRWYGYKRILMLKQTCSYDSNAPEAFDSFDVFSECIGLQLNACGIITTETIMLHLTRKGIHNRREEGNCIGTTSTCV